MTVPTCGWIQPEPTRPWHYYRIAKLDAPSACGAWGFDPSADAVPLDDPPNGARLCLRCARAVEAEDRRTEWIGAGQVIRWRATSQLHDDGPGPWRWHTAVVQQVQSCLILPNDQPMYSIEPSLSVHWARRAYAISLVVMEVTGDGHHSRGVAIFNPDLPVVEWERVKPD